MKVESLKGKIFTVRELYERDNKGKYKGHILFKEPIAKVKDIKLAVEFLKSEPTSLCLDCNTKWDGLIKKCDDCGAKYSKKPYQSRIDYYIAYEDVDAAFPDLYKGD